MGLVADAATGETGGRVFEVFERIFAAVERLDDFIGFGAKIGYDVFAAFGHGGGEEFVVEEEFPIRPDAELCTAWQL